MKWILGYVDPGSGFIFLQNSSFLWGIILGLLGVLFVFFKFLFRFIKKLFWFFFTLLVIFLIIVLMANRSITNKKVIILGIDAMDPQITERLMQEGRLPTFSYLKAIGTYTHLTTTIPSESVVAWSSFVTGLNPGGHGIFDFIMRNPKDYSLYLSLNEVSTNKGKIKIQTRRHGLAFWGILSKNKVPSYIYFCPNTFPPDKLFGKMLSGMGVPDITGTMGKFIFYTTKILSEEDKDSRGKIIHIEPKNNIVHTSIYGPKVESDGQITESAVPLKITVFPDEEKILLEFQENQIFLKKSTWSDWQRLSFKISPFKSVYGILRFYLRSIKPEFELYTSPINFAPQRPPFSISYPYNYSKKLAKKIGSYYTQGMPHDTWALTEGRLGEEVFLEITDEILQEKKKILKEALKEFKGGLFFFYFDTLDAIQHMFWRYLEQRHPLYEASSDYKNTIFKYYEKIDQILGDVLKKISQDTTLIVLSDHGFSSFCKSVHLNRWLLENRFLFLKEEKDESKEFFKDIDWSKTKAYALGFGGIYLNRIGREYYGIVSEPEVQELKEAIKEGLKQLKDAQSGEFVVKNVYFQEEIFQGPYVKDAPDLVVGFNAGYRASWQTALGGVPNLLIEDNRKKWSGDHLIDSTLVPGLIFVNKKLDLKDPSIIDIAPTILSLFGIPESKEMPGKTLFKNEDK